MGFIEDLFYGNIEAQNYSSPELGSELKNKLNDLTELEKQISDKLSGEEKNLFLKYTDKYIEFAAQSLTDFFRFESHDITSSAEKNLRSLCVIRYNFYALQSEDQEVIINKTRFPCVRL